MSGLFENITELPGKKNKIIVIEKASDFDLVEYKVLLGQKFDWMVPCYKCTFNGHIELFFLTEKYHKLIDILPTIGMEDSLAIIRQICESVKAVETNGFLNASSLILESDCLYYDTYGKQIKLMYLPAIFQGEKRSKNTANALYELIESISHYNQNEKIRQLLSEVKESSKGSFDINYLWLKFSAAGKKRFLRETKEQSISGTSFYDSRSIDSRYNGDIRSSAKLYLESFDCDRKITFHVNKAHFLIGRKHAVVDGKVPFFYIMVDGIHCSIDLKKGYYFVTDSGSINGTFLNGNQLKKGASSKLNNGDILQLANLKFRVRISAEE